MKIKTCYFSPTGGTLQVARHLAEALGRRLGADVEYHSYTRPSGRESLPQFAPGDLVLWASPVYAGRLPNKMLDYVRQSLHADGNPAVALVTFGNRAYDNALAELVGLMREGGMHPVGAAAMVARHAFSDTLGAGRPDADDLTALDRFAAAVAERVKAMGQQPDGPLAVPGDAHAERYYTPLRTDLTPAVFLKAKPVCDPTRCTGCGLCAEVCPMGSIGMRDGFPSFDGLCIKCQACRRRCPAITFTDDAFLSHVAMIEGTYAAPKPCEFFV